MSKDNLALAKQNYYWKRSYLSKESDFLFFLSCKSLWSKSSGVVRIQSKTCYRQEICFERKWQAIPNFSVSCHLIKISRQRFDLTYLCTSQNRTFLPLDDNFLVLIIFAAYSTFVSLCTHRRTMLNAPLRAKNAEQNSKYTLMSA